MIGMRISGDWIPAIKYKKIIVSVGITRYT